MKIITDIKVIDAILERGVIVDALPDMKSFREFLLSGQQMRIYIGADPTSTSLHLSHAKNYMVLEEFRKLGHEVIVLVGDFTARIGDPSDRTTARQQLSPEEVKTNVEKWIEQIRPLIDFDAEDNPAKLKFNADWLSKLSFEEVVELAANFTVQQMLERSMFQERMKQNKPIHLHEFLYPLMQGYDSVAMDVTAELCGTDQVFNALAGRTLLKRLKDKEKFIVVVNLMENPKTSELMSKSKGTGVFLDSNANDLYGQIMSQPDEMTELLLINNTRLPLDDVAKIVKGHPREAKAKAAHAITTILHGEQAADTAAQAFEAQFSKGELPTEVPEFEVAQADWDTIELLTASALVKSKSEARRLIQQNGFRVNGETYGLDTITVADGDIIQAGKRHFRKIRLT